MYFSYPKLSPGGQSHVPLANQQEEGDETDVSLITGALRSQNLLNREPAVSSFGSSVVLRNQALTVANTNSAGKSDAQNSIQFILYSPLLQICLRGLYNHYTYDIPVPVNFTFKTNFKLSTLNCKDLKII